MELECNNCGHEWEYQEKSDEYTTCPKCQSEVKISNEAEVVEVDRHVEHILEKYTAERSSLIPILQECQDKFGYLPSDVIEEIGDYLDNTMSDIYGVITFYTRFRLEPLGEHTIRVCHGTACHVKGIEKIDETIHNELGIETGETTEDGLFNLERVACLGCCSLAPVIMVDDTVYGNLTEEKAKNVIDKYRGDEK